ncbi:MAG: PAS domain S-box protein, partial [Actinomycetota bacterium]
MLSAVGAAAGAMVVVRPEVIAGRMTDAELMWVSPGAHAQFGLVIGLRLSDVYGSDIAGLPLTVVAEAALRSPGLQVVAGPYEVSSPAGVSSMYELSAVADLEMVVVLFLDRTEQFLERLDVGRSQQLFRGLVDSLDSSEVVLRPQEVGGVVVDAVVEWANQATRNMSRDEQSLVPRDRVSERYLDVEEWLIDANEAWRGRPSSRILSRVAGHLGWRVCEQTINRVSDVLLQSTHNRSNDEDLLAKLSASEYRFASLIEDLPSTVFVGDFGSTEIDFISPNSITLLGRNPLQLHESSVLAALLHPDDRQRWGDVIEWATSDRLSYSADWRMRRDDGSDFTVSVSMVRRANVLAVEGYVALMLDVTDERARQRQLEESERLQSLSRAAGSIAHDFNNLLMVVAGNIDLARGLVPLAEMPLAEAKRATEKATALARTMLMFARAHPGHIGLVSVSSTLERLAEFASFEVPYGVYIVNSCATDLPPVLVDPEHLEHV